MAVHIGIQTSSWVNYPGGADNETYILDVNHDVTVSESFGIGIGPPYVGQTVQILGRVIVTGTNRIAVLDSAIGGSRVEVGETGQLFGGYGIYMQESGVDVLNNGYIKATNTGIITSAGAGQIINNGEIISEIVGIGSGGTGFDEDTGPIDIVHSGSINAIYGIVTHSSDTTILIDAGSVIRATGYGILNSSGADSTAEVTIAGRIFAHRATAYSGADGGIDHVTNSGHVVGSIWLRGGDDTYVDRKGKVEGYVMGDAGNDTYIVASKNISVFEYAGQGHDKVKSAASFSLVDKGEIEVLRLTGAKNINATGNEYANILTGNKGSNRLDGGGNDDVLTGGKGRDTFVFRSGTDSDTIRDFEQGRDLIDLTGYDTIGKFRHLVMSEAGGSVVIDLSSDTPGDAITIENARLRDFDKGDFIFG